MKKWSWFIIVVMVIGVSGCATPRLSFPSAPKNEPTKKYHHNETLKKEPYIVDVVSKSGETTKVMVGERVEQTYSSGLEAVQPKPTLFSQLWGMMGPWLILFILLNVLGIFFPVIGVIMGGVNRGLGKGAKRIVTGMDKVFDRLKAAPEKTYTAQEVESIIKQILSSEYDDATKKLVAKIKSKK